MVRRFLSVLLVLSLLPVCGFAEVDSEYLEELRLLNAYMKTAGENAPAGIEKICDQIEGNGRIGEYTLEFGIYANVLRLLEAEDYTGALSEAGDLLNGSSFEKFRAYLEDGEELRSWGLYALDSVERLYSYVQGRASEASNNWKRAAQYYSTCQQFMDARERKQFANLVTPTPSPTPTPTPTPSPTPNAIDFLSEHWKNDAIAVARGWNNDKVRVKRIQQALNASGYVVRDVDGMFGQKSALSLSKWQETHMISGSSGICTPLTAIRLFSEKVEEYSGAADENRVIALRVDNEAKKYIDKNGDAYVMLRFKNSSKYPIVAFAIQCSLDNESWDLTGCEWIDGNDTVTIPINIPNGKQVKSMTVHVAEVQYADGSIISDYVTYNLSGYGKNVYVKITDE